MSTHGQSLGLVDNYHEGTQTIFQCFFPTEGQNHMEWWVQLYILVYKETEIHGNALDIPSLFSHHSMSLAVYYTYPLRN